MKFQRTLSSLAIAAALVASPTLALASSAAAATSGGALLDLGVTNPNEIVQVLLVLQAKNVPELQRFVYATVDPHSGQYHQFLTTSQFASRFGASPGDIQNVVQFLNSNGITTTSVMADSLAIEATGTVGQFEQAFQLQVHDFKDASGRTFHKPLQAAKFPPAIKSVVLAATGLDTGMQQQSHHEQAPNVNLNDPTAMAQTMDKAKAAIAAATPLCGNCAVPTGLTLLWTPGDVDNFYNATPLLTSGVTGQGSTVGVIALAGFQPSDAFNYWNWTQMHPNPNRISQVSVFGGSAPDGSSGQIETSADVEIAGGVAPDANVVVYNAPNTDGGFLASVYQAVSDNVADSLSISWGMPELLYGPAFSGGVDHTSELVAFDQAFLEAGAQGVPVFIAAGDSGAYDMHEELASFDQTQPYNYSDPLTVNAPASDPFVTAAGGTTVPPGIASLFYAFYNNLMFWNVVNGQYISTAPTSESVWGEDWIVDWRPEYFVDGLASPAVYEGGGGGVSTLWAVPQYQSGFTGVQLSQPGQALTVLNPSTSPWTFGSTQTTPETLVTLPANFAGRNLPDVSANADPLTGYSFGIFGIVSFGLGGTSMVAPDLSGFSALLKQKLGHRLGFLNPQLYRLQQSAGYGSTSGLNAITTGDNWFYHGAPNYNPGSGLGSLNVANLAAQLQAQDQAAAASQ